MNKTEFFEICKNRFVEMKKEIDIYYVYFKYEIPISKITITLGGISGGNCWNDNEPEVFSNDVPDIDLDFIFDILLEVNENIPYLVCRNIKKESVNIYNKRFNEYYGNHTDKKIIEIDFANIAEILIEKGYLEND